MSEVAKLEAEFDAALGIGQMCRRCHSERSVQIFFFFIHARVQIFFTHLMNNILILLRENIPKVERPVHTQKSKIRKDTEK